MIRNLWLLLGLFFSSFSFSQTVGIIQNDSLALNGYTLFSPTGFNKTYLIDNCGFIINEWESEHDPGMMAYLLPNGNLLRTARISSSFNAGETGGKIEIFDWDGNLIWSYNYSSPVYHQHHEVEPLSNGNILVLAWEKRTQAEAIMAGRNPDEVNSQGVWSEKVVEIEPIGSDGINIIWEWYLWDHLVQDFNDTLQNFMKVNEHPELIDINFAAENGTDWVHLNSIDYNEELDQIILSSRNFNELWIIDHSTTTLQASQHSGGASGMGGDILYRWGNPQAYQRGDETDQKLFAQHDVHWIKPELNDEGKIMIFNNGIGRPTGDYSSVDVINPPLNVEGNYVIDNDLPFDPIDLDWTYEANPPFDFVSARISGAQRLPNGNTLICNGRNGEFFEVTEEGEQVWLYVNPVGNNGPVSQGNQPVQNDVFQTIRYSPDYAAFEGRDLIPQNPVELNPTMNSCEIYDGTMSSVGNFPKLDGIRILGNPIYDFLSIENLTGKKVKIEVFDMIGQPIFSDFSKDEIIRILSLNWNIGMYFIQISNENSTEFFTQKLIKH